MRNPARLVSSTPSPKATSVGHSTKGKIGAPVGGERFAGHPMTQAGGIALIAALAIVVVLAIVVAICRARSVTNQQWGRFDDARSAFFASPHWWFSQTLVIGILLVAMAWQAIIAEGPDALTITLLCFVIIVALIPVVDKITLPGTNGQLELVKASVKDDTDQLRDDAATSQLVLASAARMLSDGESAIFDARVRQTDQDVAADLSARILRDANETLSTILVPRDPPRTDGTTGPPPEPVRISAWLRTQDGTALRCVTCWPADPTLILTVNILSPEDPATLTLKTGQARNYQDMAESQRPPKGNSSDEFHGIAIVPINSSGIAIGVLQVERARQERFDGVQATLCRALAALHSSALG